MSDNQLDPVLPYIQLLAELLQTLAWPTAVVFIALFYREEICKLLPRIRKVSSSGVELEGQQKISEGLPNAEDREVIQSTALAEIADPVLLDIETKNYADLERLRFSSPDEERKQLVRALSVQQLHKSFGIAYSNIFGSQIELLRELNTRSMARADLDEYLRRVRTVSPALESVSLEQYVKFLFLWKFIEQDSSVFRITETGKSFLFFLVEQGLRQDRGN